MSKVDAGETSNGEDYIKAQEGLNFLITNIANISDNNKVNLVNMSYGPKRCDKHGLNCISDSSYYATMKKNIKQIVLTIKKMQKYRKDNDIVITLAAGNEGKPIYENVIKPLTSGSYPELSSAECEILKNNILIVGAIDTKNPTTYSNTSSNDNAFAYVNISDLPSNFEGTSFAAPRALCYISQIMEEKKLTAVQALKIAKESIAINGGKFDIKNIISADVVIKPTVSFSNIKSTTATATVRINPREILNRYPDAKEVGVTISTSSTFSTYSTANIKFNSTNGTYMFNISSLIPDTPYHAYGWVKYGSNYLDGRPEKTVEFRTQPEKNYILADTKWSCYAYGFNPADNCFLQGASGYLSFIDNTKVEFYNRKGVNYNLELTGTYTLTGNSLNLNFGDVIFTGTVFNNSLQGKGKHYAGNDIHNFRWNGTKQTTKLNVVLNRQQIIRTNRK